MIIRLFQKVIDLFTVIIMLPLAIIATIGFSLYWCIKFPFWAWSRQKRIKRFKK